MGTSLQASYETLVGEGLKTTAETALHHLGATALGREALSHYAGGLGGRVQDSRLITNVAGIYFENPVIVGPGWDKKGRAILGLHALGFAGIEGGTVPLFGQYGNDKPRLWTLTKEHDVGFNRLGFNSEGAEAFAANLAHLGPLPCPIGVNIGLNKLMPAEHAAWAHAAVIPHVFRYASYIALGVSSPNTEQVRGLQRREPLSEITQSVQHAMDEHGLRKPLFYKIDGDQTQRQIYDIVEVAIDHGVDGIIAINTTTNAAIKRKYGTRWAGEAGGLSGADPDFRRLATQTVKFIYEEAGNLLVIMGAGGVDSAEAALEKIGAGASAVQVVTAIRPTWGRVAANINRGLIERLDKDGAASIRDYIGSDTDRGPLTASGNW